MVSLIGFKQFGPVVSTLVSQPLENPFTSQCWSLPPRNLQGQNANLKWRAGKVPSSWYLLHTLDLSDWRLLTLRSLNFDLVKLKLSKLNYVFTHLARLQVVFLLFENPWGRTRNRRGCYLRLAASHVTLARSHARDRSLALSFLCVLPHEISSKREITRSLSRGQQSCKFFMGTKEISYIRKAFIVHKIGLVYEPDRRFIAVMSYENTL